MGGSLENFILDRNFQSRSKSRVFLIFGPSGDPRFAAGLPGLVISRCRKLRTRSTTTRDRNLQFRGIFSTGLLEFSPGIFPLSPDFLCSLIGNRPETSRKIARSPSGEKNIESCHVSGCHGFFWSREIFQHISCDFPRIFLRNPRADPRNNHSLLEFSEMG